MSEAAKTLYISQPTLSKGIREIEESLKLKLFDRVHGKLQLNKEGIIFRKKAIKFLHDYQKLEKFGDDLDDLPMYIGVSLTLARTSLTKVLQLFKEKYPLKQIRIYAENEDQIQNKLLDYQVDLAFVEGRLDESINSIQKISHYPLLIVGSYDSELTSKTKIKKEECLNYPFLLREKGSTLRDGQDLLMLSTGQTIQPIIESVNTEVLIQVALAGLGLTILPAPFAKMYIQNKQLREVKIEERLFTDNFAVVRKNEELDHFQEHFITCFKQVEKE